MEREVEWTHIVALCDLLHEVPLSPPLPLQLLHVLLPEFLQVAEHGRRLLVLLLQVQQSLLLPL